MGGLCFQNTSICNFTFSSRAVWEVKFDCSLPNNLFTCSQDGTLWHWDVNDTTQTHTAIPISGSRTTPYSLRSSSRYASMLHDQTSQVKSSSVEGRWNESKARSSSITSPWLSDAVQHGKVNIQDYSPGQGLSVNSLDVESQRLVCGTDGEALFIMPPLTLR